MKKILFYTQNRWAFGSIHHGLIKRLYAHGLYCNLLDWTLPTTYIEFHLLNEIYDIFMTTPEAVANLVGLGIPLSKIVCVAHCERDITLAAKNLGTEFYSQLAGMGVVCERGLCRRNDVSVVIRRRNQAPRAMPASCYGRKDNIESPRVL